MVWCEDWSFGDEQLAVKKRDHSTSRHFGVVG